MLLMQNPDACWKCGQPPEENKKLVRCSAHLPGLEGEPIEAGCRNSVHPGCLGLWALPDGKWLCRTCADNVGLEHGGDQGVVLTPDELVNTPCYSISSLKMVEGAFRRDGKKGKQQVQESVVMKRFRVKKLSIPGETGVSGVFTRPSAHYVIKRTEEEYPKLSQYTVKGVIGIIDSAWNDWKMVSEVMLQLPMFKTKGPQAEDIVMLVEEYKKAAAAVKFNAEQEKNNATKPTAAKTRRVIGDDDEEAPAESPMRSGRARRQIVEEEESDGKAGESGEDDEEVSWNVLATPKSNIRDYHKRRLMSFFSQRS